MKLIKNSLTLKYYYKILFYIFIPVVLAVIICSIITSHYIYKLEDELFNKHMNSLISLSNNMTEELHEISQTILLLNSSQHFFDVYFSNTPIPPEHNYKFTSTVITLKNLKLTKNYIDSINIIDKTNNKIIGAQGTLSFDLFFDNDYYGENYNTKDFWFNLSIPNGQMKILPLEKRSHNNSNIIPLAFFQIGDKYSQSPLVINVDKDKFSSFLLPYKLTDDSNIFIYNSTNKEIISSSGSLPLDTIDIGDAIEKSKIEPLKINVNGENFVMISHLSKDLFNDTLEYFMLIPSKDILYLPLRNKYVATLLIALCLFLAFGLCCFISLKLYEPIKSLASLFPNDPLSFKIQNSDANEMTLLTDKVKELISNNDSLTKDMTLIIPSVCEKHILNIIQQDDYDPNELEPILKRYNFSFPHNYFTTILVEFKFLEDFYKDFNVVQQYHTYEKLIPLLKVNTNLDYKKYVFKLNKNKYCLIVNSIEESIVEYCKNDLIALQELFNSSKNYITVYSGIGKTYRAIIGIHSSWKEANQIFAGLSDFTDKKICIYENRKDIITGYSLTSSEDNHIFNYLLSGNIDELIPFIKLVLSRNIDNCISESSFKDLYVHLYSIGVKVASTKNIYPSTIMNDEYIDIIRYVNSLSINDISNYITKFFSNICTYTNSINSNIEVNLKEVKNYIDNNYTKDIYLDSLADQYNINVKYMSKLLKSALGIPFKQYVTNLRILKSKELLANTNDTIENIALEAGFNSRNTFIRAFKIIEGVTPSEYRDSQKI